MDHIYAGMLAWTMWHRWKVMLLTLLVVVGSWFFFGKVQKEFIPDSDEGRFLIHFRTPLGSSIEYTNSRLEKMEAVLQRNDAQIASYFGTIGMGAQGQVNKGTVSIRLKDRRERDMSQ